MTDLTRAQESALRKLMWGTQPAPAAHPLLVTLAMRGLIHAGPEADDDRTWSLTAAGIEALGLTAEPDPAFEQAVVDHLNRALGHPERAIESKAA